MAIKPKKGMFFTLIAISLTFVVILGLTIQNEYRLRNKMYVVEARVGTINDFIKNIEKDLGRGLYITSFRALLGMQKHVTTNGVFLDDISSQFKETLLNGTIGSEESEIMNGSTFLNWTDKMEEEAEKIDILINISILNITIYHEDPWFITVESAVLLVVKDKRDTANWTKHEQIKTRLDIEGFEDPLYTINSFGKVVNIVRKANQTNFGSFPVLVNHINNSYYIESNNSPSFLMRFENRLESSPFGIESLINLNDFINQNLPTYSKSNVDYIYFGNQTFSSCVVNETSGQFSWFRLDNDAEPNNHLNDYSVNCFA